MACTENRFSIFNLGVSVYITSKVLRPSKLEKNTDIRSVDLLNMPGAGLLGSANLVACLHFHFISYYKRCNRCAGHHILVRYWLHGAVSSLQRSLRPIAQTECTVPWSLQLVAVTIARCRVACRACVQVRGLAAVRHQLTTAKHVSCLAFHSRFVSFLSATLHFFANRDQICGLSSAPFPRMYDSPLHFHLSHMAVRHHLLHHLHDHHLHLLLLVQYFTLNLRLGSSENHFLHRPSPFLRDWLHGLSDHLMFLFCSTAGFVCISVVARHGALGHVPPWSLANARKFFVCCVERDMCSRLT